jgi:hypothetical protein
LCGGPLHCLGNRTLKCASRIGKPKPRSRASRGQLRDERGQRTGSTFGQPGVTGCVTTNSSFGQPAGEKVDTTNSSVVASGGWESGAANSECGQPRCERVDATERPSWGTAKPASSRKQTDRMGNHGIRASRHELNSSGATRRRDCRGMGKPIGKLGGELVETKLLFGQPGGSSVVRANHRVRIEHGEELGGCTRRFG